MNRREVIAGLAGSVAALSTPAIAQRSPTSVLKFIPQADLALLDPIVTAAVVTRDHAALVFDMLYGVDANLIAHPQMVEGHVVENDGRVWTLTLREGLVFHDDTPVLARDAVASLRRWARKDAYGGWLLENTEELSALDDRRLRFRLRKPVSNLPYILGKEGPYLCVVMPERLAQTEPSKPVTEMVGSGPYRFIPGERVPGALNAYARWQRYVPRPGATASLLAGAKVPHIERIEWHTLPDASTAAAALQAGEMDWWALPTVDLIPLLRRSASLKIELLQKSGAMGVLKLNHLTAPFDKAAVRRALWPALQQSAFLSAARGEDPGAWQDGVGFFQPGTPMASDAGMSAITSPRSLDAAKKLLAESGYAGEPVALLMPSDFPELNAFAQVTADMLKQIGFKVDEQVLDWGTVVQRVVQQKPVKEGGWSAFCTFLPGAYTVDPGVNWYMRGNGAAGSGVGWPTSEKLEALRTQWLDATDQSRRAAIARDMQAESFESGLYVPLGRFYQPTAFNKRVTGHSAGFPTFYNIRKD